jgi:hypothetical protein
MNTLVLTFLALASVARSALPVSQAYQVELFSSRVVKALTLEVAGKALTLCGAKAEEPCLVLPPGKKTTCSADRIIHCRFEEADRSFTLLKVDSVTPFRIAPIFADVNDPPQTFLMRNARIYPASGRLQIITKMDLESYVSGVLRGAASVLHAPAAPQAMAMLARTWAMARTPRCRWI